MGPFGLPPLTFGALLVILLSIVVAIVWAVLTSGREGGTDE